MDTRNWILSPVTPTDNLPVFHVPSPRGLMWPQSVIIQSPYAIGPIPSPCLPPAGSLSAFQSSQIRFIPQALLATQNLPANWLHPVPNSRKTGNKRTRSVGNVQKDKRDQQGNRMKSPQNEKPEKPEKLEKSGTSSEASSEGSSEASSEPCAGKSTSEVRLMSQGLALAKRNKLRGLKSVVDGPDAMRKKFMETMADQNRALDLKVNEFRKAQNTDGSFNCIKCDTVLKDSRAVLRHVTTHIERPFQCCFCERKFSRQDSFRRHFSRCSHVKKAARNK